MLNDISNLDVDYINMGTVYGIEIKKISHTASKYVYLAFALSPIVIIAADKAKIISKKNSHKYYQSATRSICTAFLFHITLPIRKRIINWCNNKLRQPNCYVHPSYQRYSKLHFRLFYNLVLGSGTTLRIIANAIPKIDEHQVEWENEIINIINHMNYDDLKKLLEESTKKTCWGCINSNRIVNTFISKNYTKSQVGKIITDMTSICNNVVVYNDNIFEFNFHNLRRLITFYDLHVDDFPNEYSPLYLYRQLINNQQTKAIGYINHLLDIGFHINNVSEMQPLLHYYYRFDDIVKFLVESGADVNILNNDRNISFLDISHKTFLYLRKRALNLNIIDQNGYTPLFTRHNFDVMMELIDIIDANRIINSTTFLTHYIADLSCYDYDTTTNNRIIVNWKKIMTKLRQTGFILNITELFSTHNKQILKKIPMIFDIFGVDMNAIDIIKIPYEPTKVLIKNGYHITNNNLKNSICASQKKLFALVIIERWYIRCKYIQFMNHCLKRWTIANQVSLMPPLITIKTFRGGLHYRIAAKRSGRLFKFAEPKSVPTKYDDPLEKRVKFIID
jgi:hypothetical protein